MQANQANDFSGIDYVFLDRDGVLNRKAAEGDYITCVAELELLPEVGQAVATLNCSGRKVLVVTNQRGIALGLYSRQDLDRLHDDLRRRLSVQGGHLDAIYVCPHNNGECNCRKPLPGMFEQAFADFPGATPANSVMIGDSLRDIEAAIRLGMRAVFITDDTGDASPDASRAMTLANVTSPSLFAFVRDYLQRSLQD